MLAKKLFGELLVIKVFYHQNFLAYSIYLVDFQDFHWYNSKNFHQIRLKPSQLIFLTQANTEQYIKV